MINFCYEVWIHKEKIGLTFIKRLFKNSSLSLQLTKIENLLVILFKTLIKVNLSITWESLICFTKNASMIKFIKNKINNY